MEARLAVGGECVAKQALPVGRIAGAQSSAEARRFVGIVGGVLRKRGQVPGELESNLLEDLSVASRHRVAGVRERGGRVQHRQDPLDECRGFPAESEPADYLHETTDGGCDFGGATEL